LEAGFKDAQQELHHLSHHSNRPRPDDMVIDDHGSNIPNYKEDETTHFLAMRVLVFMRWIRLATPFLFFVAAAGRLGSPAKPRKSHYVHVV
jgi:hypothetical protein